MFSKISVPNLVLEMFSVVFAVLLAFWAKDWQEQNEREKNLENSLVQLKEEVNINAQKVAQSIRYHKETRERINESIQLKGSENISRNPKEDFKVDWKEMFPRGLTAPSDVTDAAWKASYIVNAVSEMPYGLLQKFSKIYFLQESYVSEQKQFSLTTRLVRFQDISEANFYSGIDNAINEYYWTERKLLKAYKDVLNELSGVLARNDSLQNDINFSYQ